MKRKYATCILVILLGIPWLPATGGEIEPYNSGWEFYFDNDAFALPNVYTDQDYTGGIAVSLLGRRAKEYPVSLDGLRSRIDRLFGHHEAYASPDLIEQHSIEFGAASFTPRDLAASTPIYNDRPYASLVFLANSYQATIPQDRVSFQSSFVLGALGLGLSESVQQAIHHVVGAESANGWRNQVSDGGELTARYIFSRQKIRAYEPVSLEPGYQFNSMFNASIGYITDVGYGFYGRVGRIYSPAWNFNPHLTESIMIGPPVASTHKVGSGTERYFWAGVNLRYRIYNALLQGQFRDSQVTLSADQINPLVLEGWVGYVRSVGSNYRINISVRANTSELKVGEQRAPVWVSIVIGKYL